MTDMIANLEVISSDQSVSAIKDSQTALEDIRTTLAKTIAQDISSVTQSIKDAGAGIRRLSSDMTKTFERISDVAGNNTFDNFDLADDYIAEYSRYHFWAGLAVSAVLLMVLMCVVCGLLCGICGKRPDGYGDDCCNKGAGSRFLMWFVDIWSYSQEHNLSKVNLFQWRRSYFPDNISAHSVLCRIFLGRYCSATRGLHSFAVSYIKW